MFKAEAEGRSVAGGSSLVYSSGQSLGPGGRKLKAVDSGADLFDDDDGEGRKRREREMGEEGDMDEQVYEEEFADDEEPMEVDDKDEEAKETEVN
jgi:transcription initiation factor TFIIF subunit alpha